MCRVAAFTKGITCATVKRAVFLVVVPTVERLDFVFLVLGEPLPPEAYRLVVVQHHVL